MNVEKKIKYDGGKTNYSTMNTINKSPMKSKH